MTKTKEIEQIADYVWLSKTQRSWHITAGNPLQHASTHAEKIRQKAGRRKHLSYEEICAKQGVKLSEQLRNYRVTNGD